MIIYNCKHVVRNSDVISAVCQEALNLYAQSPP